MKNSLEGLISLDLLSTKLFCFRARVYCSVLFVYLSQSCETFQRALWRPSGNSCYWSWACCEIFLCLERQTNEAKGSIQCRIDPLASFACQTADNCNKSYCWTPWAHFDPKLNFILVVTSKLQVFAKHNRTIIINYYCNALFYYKASSVSGQADPNPALWLATRAGEMEPSCPLGTTRCIMQAKLPRKPYNKSFIDQVCSVKMTGYWPRSFFFRVYGLGLRVRP